MNPTLRAICKSRVPLALGGVPFASMSTMMVDKWYETSRLSV